MLIFSEVRKYTAAGRYLVSLLLDDYIFDLNQAVRGHLAQLRQHTIAVFEFFFHGIHSKKVLDNRYTDVITYCMLSRQLTRPTHPPARLNPSLPYSCSLFAFVPALPSFRINHLQPLFTNHPGGGYPTLPRRASRPPSHAPCSASIPSALNQFRILPVATSVGPFRQFRIRKVFFVPLRLCGKFHFVRPLFSCSYKSLFPRARPSFPFIHLQIPLRATPFVSHPYKTMGVWGRECRLC
jgi:hypothetical protein